MRAEKVVANKRKEILKSYHTHVNYYTSTSIISGSFIIESDRHSKSKQTYIHTPTHTFIFKSILFFFAIQ